MDTGRMNDMFRRWICLTLALAICGASLAFAEDIALEDNAAIVDPVSDELLLDDMSEVLDFSSMGDLELDVDLPIDAEPSEPQAEDPASRQDAEPEDDEGSVVDAPEPSQEELLPEEEQAAIDEEAVAERTGASGDGEDTPVLTLSASKLLIGVGEKCDLLTATLTPANDDDTITWRSGKSSVAKVNAVSGRITGVSVGTAVIYAKSDSGAEAKCTVTVAKAPGKVTLNKSKLTLSVGKTYTLKATLPTDTGSTLTFSTKNSKIAKVNATSGLVKAVGVGSTTITVKTFNGHTASCNVTVAGTPAKVKLAVGTVTIGLNQTYDLAPRILTSDGDVIDGASYTVKSSKSSGLSASDQGVIKGLKKGSYTVTVTASNGVKATCKVTVVAAPSKVTLTPATVKLAVGKTRKLKVSFPTDTMASYTFSSSKKSVAKVSSTGVVTAVGAGSAVITVKTHNSKTAKCKVTVISAATDFVVSPASVSAKLSDGGIQLTWSFGSPDEYEEVTFKSDKTSVAKVDANGYITFVGAGTAHVTATTDSGLEATVTVTVLSDEGNGRQYRLFAVYSYYDSLPFSRRNARSMAKVFGNSKINDKKYTTKVLGNPSKSKILSGISSFFADTDDDDLSIVYFCSHGHNTQSSYSGYKLSLKGYENNKNNSKYYLTSKEIFNSIKAIDGNVILILDSCYSGTFINDMKSKLNAQNGRIAVLTAASNTRATYYTKVSKSVDFFTYFLLQGLGYNEKEDWWNKNSGADKGSYPGYLSADKKGNNNGRVSLAEFYNFASKSIAANIPTFMKKSWYWGDRTQVQKTRFYAGNLKTVVVYKPD